MNNQKESSLKKIKRRAAVRMLAIFIISLVFWKAETFYFSNLSLAFSLGLSAVLLGVLMVWWGATVLTESLSRGPELDATLKNDYLNKIMILENRILELKAETNSLKQQLSGSPKPSVASDQKVSLIGRQRVFLHDLASKIQVLQIATEGAMEIASEMDDKNGERLRAKLEMLNRSLNEIVSLHKTNRDFLIIAS